MSWPLTSLFLKSGEKPFHIPFKGEYYLSEDPPLNWKTITGLALTTIIGLTAVAYLAGRVHEHHATPSVTEEDETLIEKAVRQFSGRRHPPSWVNVPSETKSQRQENFTADASADPSENRARQTRRTRTPPPRPASQFGGSTVPEWSTVSSNLPPSAAQSLDEDNFVVLGNANSRASQKSIARSSAQTVNQMNGSATSSGMGLMPANLRRWAEERP